MKKLLGILVLVLVACLACTAFATGYTPKHEVEENAVINWGDIDEITKIAGHRIGEYIWEEGNSCTEWGVATFDCLDNPDEFHIVRVRPHDHWWASESGNPEWGNVVKAPTCSETGLAEDVCLNCGEPRPEVTRVIEKVNHEYDDDHYVIYRAPSCTAVGLGQHVCIFCGEKLANEKEADMVVLPMVPHNFSDWEIIHHSTCEEYGYAERACLWCGKMQRLGNLVVGWDEEAKEPIINTYNADLKEVVEKGKDPVVLIDYVPGVAKLNPNYAANAKDQTFDTESLFQAWKKDAEKKFEFVEVKNWLRDCYTREITYACPYCYDPYYDYDEDPEEVLHKPFVVTLKAPITIAHIYNEIPEEDWWVDEEGTVHGLSKAPTCTEDGYYVYLCKNDELIDDWKDHVKHSHPEFDPVTTSYKALAELNESVKVTSADGKVTKVDHQMKIEKRPALGHDFSDWVLSRTFHKDGKEYAAMVRTCKVCGGTENEVVEQIPDDGDHFCPDGEHEWMTLETVDATCTEDGKIVRECTVCGLKEVEELPAIGHTDSKEKVWKAATCTEEGLNEYTCSVCEEVYYKTVPALGHDAVVDEAVAPTVEATGLTEGSHCARCGEVLVAQEVLPKLLDGLVKQDDGDWYYYEEGEFIDDKTGVVEFEGGKFIVVNGVKSKAMGLTNCPGDVFYYLVEGQIQEVTQLAEYKGAWFAIKDGALDTSVNGLVDYDGGKFLFSDGWLRKDINGLCQVGDDWYFFANGQLQQVSQVASYDGEFFVIKDGKLDADYNGTIEYDGATFNVVAGQLYPIAE